MMEEKSLPLVSVVVPCYNHEKYVTETIESIINQTYKNIELIVIDDGSKDNSVQVIQELADEYAFTFIHRPNKGLSATLNEGITFSKGKYISLCASDDKYEISKIETQVKFLENQDEFIMCYSNIFEFNETVIKKRTNKNYISGNLFEYLFLKKFSIPTLSTLINKDVFQTVGLFDENLYFEDWDMWLKIANKYKIGYCNEYVAYYRSHQLNMHKNTDKMEKSTLLVIDKWKKHKLYKKALVEAKITFFKSYATFHKKNAILKIIPLLPYFYKKKVIAGMIRLILPYSLIEKLKFFTK